jgi:hypothetical protein
LTHAHLAAADSVRETGENAEALRTTTEPDADPPGILDGKGRVATRSVPGGTVAGMQQTRAAAAPATLDAVLERITYANQETGYTVARVATARGSELLTVVGALLGAQPGESLRLRGRWSSHPQYGRQFEVVRFATVLPATVQGSAGIWARG